MTFEVVFSATARRDMNGIPPRVMPAIVEFALGDLAASPRLVGKPLERELKGSSSARRGSYRVLYEIHDDEKWVVVLRVAHRADLYRIPD